MKKLLKQRTIYNLNSNQEMFKILDQLSLEQLTEQRGGCITGSVDPTVTTLDLVAHNAYIFIYLYKIFHKKRIKSVYNQELLDYQLSSLRMNPSDTYESLKALTFKLDEELINFMENLDMTSYDAEDFTAPDLYDFLSQTAAG